MPPVGSSSVTGSGSGRRPGTAGRPGGRLRSVTAARRVRSSATATTVPAGWCRRAVPGGRRRRTSGTRRAGSSRSRPGRAPATRTVELDGCGRVRARTDACGDVTRWVHHPTGRVASVEAPGGGTSRFGWDAAGRLVSAVDANGAETTYRWDAAGFLTGVTDPLGGVQVHHNDPMGRLVAWTDQLGHRTDLHLDRAGRLIGHRDPSGRGGLTRIASHRSEVRGVAALGVDPRTQNGRGCGTRAAGSWRATGSDTSTGTGRWWPRRTVRSADLHLRPRRSADRLP